MKLIIPFLSILIFNSAFSQNKFTSITPSKSSITQDSSLSKIVYAINDALKARAIELKAPHVLATWSNNIIIPNEGSISLDSLYKYKLSDFSRISISFTEQPAIFGSMVDFGVIFLHRKTK